MHRAIAHPDACTPALTSALELVVRAGVYGELAQLEEHEDDEADDGCERNQHDDQDDALGRERRRRRHRGAARRSRVARVAVALRPLLVGVEAADTVAAAQARGACAALGRAADDGGDLHGGGAGDTWRVHGRTRCTHSDAVVALVAANDRRREGLLGSRRGRVAEELEPERAHPVVRTVRIVAPGIDHRDALVRVVDVCSGGGERGRAFSGESPSGHLPCSWYVQLVPPVVPRR